MTLGLRLRHHYVYTLCVPAFGVDSGVGHERKRKMLSAVARAINCPECASLVPTAADAAGDPRPAIDLPV